MLIHKNIKLSTQKLKTLINDKNNSFGNEIFYKNRISDEEFFEGSNRLVLKSDSHFDAGELLLSLFEQLRGLTAGTTITLNQHSLKQEIIKQINHIAITNQQYFNAEFSQAFHLWEKNKNFTNMQEIETIVSILQNSLKKNSL